MSDSADSRSDLGSHAEEEEWDDWEEDESEAAKSLFSSETFASVDEALDFDANTHGFDLRKWREETGASEYDTLKAINFIRTEVAAGRDPRPALAAGAAADGAAPWSDDAFLRPALADDELLLHDWEAEGDATVAGGPAAAAGADDEVTAMLEDMRQLAMADPAVRDLLMSQGLEAGGASTSGAAAGPSGAAGEAEAGAAAAAAEEAAAEIDAAYFESYSFFDIHRDMLGDRVRTEAYRAALEGNPALLSGATVLDVGCGTGVLSMFAARGGAASVTAVDGSPEIAAVARKIVEKNGFAERISVVSSKIEDLKALPAGAARPDGKVDVLVSEWMGYALLFESMLDSVLAARDAFLRPGGAVLPDVANVYVAAADASAGGLDFWADVYGLDMSVVADSLRAAALREAVVRVVPSQALLTQGQRLVSLDLATMTPGDQDFSAEFELRAAAGPRTAAALVVWFDCLFSARFCGEAPQELPTGPESTPTHWAQVVLELPAAVGMAPAAAGVPGAAAALRGRLSMARRPGRHRTLDISVEYAAVAADGSVGPTRVQLYAMGVGGTGKA